MSKKLLFPLIILLVAAGVYFFSSSQKEPINPLTQTPPGVQKGAGIIANLPLTNSTSAIPVVLGKPDSGSVGFRGATPLDSGLKTPKDHTSAPAPTTQKKKTGFSLPDYLFLEPEKPSPPRYFSLSLGTKTIKAEFADTLRKELRGLSGRKGLEKDTGLFYVFPQPDFHYFWMKDMLFPIDIIWISSEGRVVEIKKNLSPDTFPDKFTSRQKAQYVVEVSAGFADRNGIAIGAPVDLSSVPK